MLRRNRFGRQAGALKLTALAVVALVVSLVALGGCSDSPREPETPRTSDGDFISFGHDVYDFVPGSRKTVNGVTLQLTDDADFQVVDRKGVVLWRTGTHAACEGNCRVVLQADGNLVLSGPQGSLWSSGTSGSPSATLIFQPRRSYLTIRNSDYDVVWTSDGDLTTAAPGTSADTRTGARAVPVRSFLDSLAVNSHMDQYERDATEVLRKLDYLGIRTIRDHYAADGSLRANYQYLAEHGIRFDMLQSSNDFDVLIHEAEVMKGLPNGALIAVEGPNEINNFPFSCNGSTWSKGWPNDNGPAAECFMRTYYKRIKDNPLLSDTPVYQLTGGTSVVDADKYGMLTLDGKADLANIHPYPSPTDQPRSTMLTNLGSDYYSVRPSGSVITETGYQSATVGERAQAIYYLNLYLDAFQLGFPATYVYELTDNPHETHGFFDGAGRPKASATALHNLTTLLADVGEPQDGNLGYSLAGMPENSHSLLLQRSDGAFNLILWDERQIWNGVDVTPESRRVTVDLSRPFSKVVVQRPATDADPRQELSSVSSVPVDLAGEPVVLTLTP